MIHQNEGNNHSSLRILQMGSTAYRGGVTTAITTLCKALYQEGHEVMLVTDGGDLTSLQELGIQCIVTDYAQKPISILCGALAVNRAIRQFHPDVIHVHGRAPALCCYLSGRIPDWFTLHNTHFTERVGLMDIGILRRLLSPKGRRFFVLDERARTYLQKSMGVKRSNIDVIINGVDCNYYRPPTTEERKQARAQFNVGDEQTLVLFVGRLHPSKQPWAVTTAAKVARDSGRRDLRFAIVGAGELEEQTQKDIESTGIQDICKLYGWMDPRQAYFAADLLVMPSLYEGFGMVAVEALATGLPVLRSRTGGAEQMIVEGKTGFCCGTEVTEFIKLLMCILEKPEQLHSMRTHAHEWVRMHFSSQAQAKIVVQKYRSYLQERSS
jgi:glycosyltransferase involved in cell wall biosynthesis